MTAVAVQSIAWFKDLDISAVPRVGGKGASLGELRRAGIAIPDGFVLTTEAFRSFIGVVWQQLGMEQRIAALKNADNATLERHCAEIRAAVAQQPCPGELRDTLSIAYQQLSEHGKHAVAVRSSATSEDSAEASFAGLQDTYLWVRDEPAMLAAVKKCWASLYNAESVSYRLRLDVSEAQLAMAVVVQRMVNSRCSGVMFTRSPTTGDRSVVTLEASWGLGSSIVSGEVTPDRFVINKITREITRRDIADKHLAHVPCAAGGVLEQEVAEHLRQQQCVSDDEIMLLTDIARQVERHYGKPQDIEWALDQDGQVLLLQSRPETVWASKDSAPVAKPAARPFDHIFKVMGGQRKP